MELSYLEFFCLLGGEFYFFFDFFIFTDSRLLFIGFLFDTFVVYLKNAFFLGKDRECGVIWYVLSTSKYYWYLFIRVIWFDEELFPYLSLGIELMIVI